MVKLIIFSSRSGGPYKQHYLLYQYLLNDGYNVVHWSGFWKWILLHFIYGKNIRILTNVPFIFRFKNGGYYLNIHGNYNIEKSLSNPLGYFYEVNTQWAKKVILPSLFLKKVLTKNSAVIIPNFVEEITPTEVFETKERIRLVTVTNFNFKDKALGIVNIVRSLSWLKIKEPVVFDVYGDGKFFDEIKSKCRKIDLPQNIMVNFGGYSKNVVAELSNSDIFVYWSNLDVSPVCLKEAMACGLPIVINNYLPFKECVCKGNLFCSNEKDFSDQIEKLIVDKSTRDRIGLENKIFYKKLVLDNKKIIDDWKKILGLDVIPNR